MKWIKERPACPGLVVETPSAADTEQSKNAEKNRKKKEAKKRAAEKKANSATAADSAETRTAGNTDNEKKLSERLAAVQMNDEGPRNADEVKKRLKNLRKRLAQIDALKAKLDSGEISKPDPDQVRKVQRREEVVDEINDLEMKL